MHTAEKQYETIKCERCGHERQGRRIIRLPSADYAEWKKINDSWGTSVNWGLIITAVGFSIAGAIAIAVPTLLFQTIPTIFQLGIGIGVGIPGAAITVLLLWWFFARARSSQMTTEQSFWTNHADVLDGEDPERVSILPIEE